MTINNETCLPTRSFYSWVLLLPSFRVIINRVVLQNTLINIPQFHFDHSNISCKEMPSGHLKHKENLSRKKALGGGSHNCSKKDAEHQKQKRSYRKMNSLDCEYDEDEIFFEDYNEDFFNDACTQSSSKQVGLGESSAECLICCDTAWPLVKLMKNCHHEPACYNCLRKIYIEQAQESVSNYPLKCFHPECNLLVRGDQLEARALFNSDLEIKKHHRFASLSKLYKQPEGSIVHCPLCDHPHPCKVQDHMDEFEVRRIQCNGCKESYLVGKTYIRSVKGDEKNEAYQATRVVENIKYEPNFGHNEGWGRCPGCKMIVNKGAGCNHMFCACGRHFNWHEAVEKAKDERRSFYAWKDR